MKSPITRARSVSPAGDQRGMTLVEVLVALVIISIGLVGLAAVLPISSYGLQEGNQLSTATFLAEQRLEQVKAAQWTEIPATDCLGTSATWSFGAGGVAPSGIGGGCNPNNFNDESVSSNPLPSPYGNYTRQVRIRDCSAGGSGCGVSDAALRMVTVRASYTPLQGIGGVATAQKFVELTMLVARR